jgi:hypothetical protein
MGRNPQPREIVGVAADVRQQAKDQEPGFGLYVPSVSIPQAVVIVRTNVDPLLLAGAVQTTDIGDGSRATSFRCQDHG